MSTPPSGLREEGGVFGEDEPQVSVEVERADSGQQTPGEAGVIADDSPLRAGGGDPYSLTYEPHTQD
ncbi:MAG TPA: hypothetical protein VK781_04965 [Solirubrobacteraceae bacterium]|nr:hypothetical protein [Solirubrobacteraceae bacterium]